MNLANQPLYLRWEIDPFLIGSLLTAVVCYALATTLLRPYIAAEATFSRKHALLFYSAIIAIFLTEASPLHNLADDYLFSAHMFQHLALSYIIAPMLIASVPVWLLDAIFANRYSLPLSRFLYHPVVAGTVFTLLFSLWHFPVFYEAALRNATLHHFEHVVFLIISIMMWFPAMSRSQKLPAMPYLSQAAYFFFLPIAQLAVFSLITYASTPIYQAYVNAPRAWGIAALNDQSWAGVIMKLGSMFAFGVALVQVFLRWYKEENPEEYQSYKGEKQSSSYS